MPAKFQKALDFTLYPKTCLLSFKKHWISLYTPRHTYSFLHDIIIVTRGSKLKHIKDVYACLTVLDDANLRLKLPKRLCETWNKLALILHIKNGCKPLTSRTKAVFGPEISNDIYTNTVIYGLHCSCYKLLPQPSRIELSIKMFEEGKQNRLIRYSSRSLRKDEETKITNAAKNVHFNQKLHTRVWCDAFREGLGCALEQQTQIGRKPISYASRFLNQCEQKYSIFELDLKGV